MQPRPAAAWVKAKSLLLGLSIPAVVAGVMLLLWPSGGSGSGLPDEVQDQYQEHFEKGRLGEAAVLIRKAKKEKKIDQEAASKLEAELRDAALKPYQEQLDKGNFAEAARVITMASRERVIQPRDSNRLHKDVMERALGKYRDMLGAENLREADALAEELATGDALPTALRRNFQNDITFEKQQVAQKLERAGQDAFEAKKWDDALDAVRKIERLGPPKPDVVFMMAEAYRNVGKEDDAMAKYKEFIDNVTPPHDHFDDALFHRAKLLASAGRSQEARDLYKRLINEVPSSSLRPEAEREMR
jgi:tetratricopeptide (TPR) repeat protein